MEHLLRQMQVATGTFTALLDVVKIHENRKLVRELQPLPLLASSPARSMPPCMWRAHGLPGVQAVGLSSAGRVHCKQAWPFHGADAGSGCEDGFQNHSGMAVLQLCKSHPVSLEPLRLRAAVQAVTRILPFVSWWIETHQQTFDHLYNVGYAMRLCVTA